jgi:RNA polymerase sigma-70 factor (ECF subfamily)
VLTDFELLEAWRAGDKQAGNSLFERHLDSVTRFFRNKVGPTRLEDLIQKTFLVCVEKRDSFEGRSSFRTYLFAVAHNILRNAYRANQRQGERYEFGTVSVAEMGPGPMTIAAKHQDQQILLQALRSIPLDYQIVLELTYWENLEGQEIAEVLGKPLGTVRTHIRRGKQKLQEAISQLSMSEAQLQKTMTNLESWARQLRDQVEIPQPV